MITNFSELGIYDLKSLACVNKSSYEDAIFFRMQKFEIMREKIFCKSDFSILSADTPLFESDFIKRIENFRLKEKYQAVLAYLKSKKISILTTNDFYKKDTDPTWGRLEQGEHTLFNWSFLVETDANTYSFLLDFGLPVKKCTRLIGGSSTFAAVIWKKDVGWAQKLIEAGAILSKCKEFIAEAKTWSRNPESEYRKKLEALEVFIQIFANRASRDSIE